MLTCHVNDTWGLDEKHNRFHVPSWTRLKWSGANLKRAKPIAEAILRCKLMLCQTLIGMAVNWLATIYQDLLMLISVESARVFAEGVVELQERFAPLHNPRSAQISNWAAAAGFCSDGLLQTWQRGRVAPNKTKCGSLKTRATSDWRRNGSSVDLNPLLLMKSGSYLQHKLWGYCRKSSSLRH